jgi:hypothetical protein
MLDTMHHRTDLDPTVADSEPNRSAEIASHGFPYEGDLVGVQHLPCGYQVALAHLDRSRWCQGREHAGSAGQAGGDTLWPGAIGCHQLEQPRHRSLGKLGRVAVSPAQRGRWKEDVRQAADASLGVIEEDRDAAAKAYGDQCVIGQPTTEVSHPDHYYPAAHAVRR